MMKVQVLAETSLRGRPRDPGLEERVFDHAMALYAQAGWAGFTFEAVARRSGAGKAALYRRWPTRGALLRRTFEARWLTVTSIDTGDVLGDLIASAQMVADTLTGPYGEAHPRIALDMSEHPEVLGFLRPYAEATVREGRDLVRRAIARGELPPSVDPGFVMDLVVGAVTNHVRTTPRRLRGRMLLKLPGFIDALTDAVLTGFGAIAIGGRK